MYFLKTKYNYFDSAHIIQIGMSLFPKRSSGSLRRFIEISSREAML